MLNKKVVQLIRLFQSVATFPIDQLIWADESRLISTARKGFLITAMLAYYGGFVLIWVAVTEGKGAIDLIPEITDGVLRV